MIIRGQEMSEAPSPYPDATSQDFAGAFLPGKDGFDREKLLRAADAARLEMEALAAEIRDLGLSGISCAGGRLNITPPWPG
jgi:hypothetical protein